MTTRTQQCTAAALLVALTVSVTGCQDEEIRRYQVPKPETQAAPKAKVRLVAAIFPHKDRTWFFKLTGPTALIDAQEAAFQSFIRSVRFTDDEKEPITWTVPDGWRKAVGNPDRFATFRVGPNADAPELTVVPLGAQSGSLLANINRWRDQIGLKHISQDDLPKVAKGEKINDIDTILVDMSGPGGQLKMSR